MLTSVQSSFLTSLVQTTILVTRTSIKNSITVFSIPSSRPTKSNEKLHTKISSSFASKEFSSHQYSLTFPTSSYILPSSFIYPSAMVHPISNFSTTVVSKLTEKKNINNGSFSFF